MQCFTFLYLNLYEAGFDGSRSRLHRATHTASSGNAAVCIFVSIRLTKWHDTKFHAITTLRFEKIRYSSFPQLFYPLMTRQFFCDFHEKSEDFCVS